MRGATPRLFSSPPVTNADVVRGTYPDGYPPRRAGSEFPVPDFEERDAEEAEAESEAGKQKQRQEQQQQQQQEQEEPGATKDGVADSKQQTWRGSNEVDSMGEPEGGPALDATKASAGEIGAGASSTVIEPAHPVV